MGMVSADGIEVQRKKLWMSEVVDRSYFLFVNNLQRSKGRHDG